MYEALIVEYVLIPALDFPNMAAADDRRLQLPRMSVVDLKVVAGRPWQTQFSFWLTFCFWGVQQLYDCFNWKSVNGQDHWVCKSISTGCSWQPIAHSGVKRSHAKVTLFLKFAWHVWQPLRSFSHSSDSSYSTGFVFAFSAPHENWNMNINHR